MKLRRPSSHRQQNHRRNVDLVNEQGPAAKSLRKAKPGTSDRCSPLVSYNLWRSSQTMGRQSSNPTTPTIIKDLGKQAEIRGEQRRLARVLRTADEDWLLKQADRVENCRRLIRLKANGAVDVLQRTCDHKLCGYCSRRQARTRAEDLSHALCNIEAHYPSSKHFYAFITLTIDDRRLQRHERNVEGKIKAIRREMTRFLNQRSMKNEINIGCYYKIEVTFSKTNRANVHAHVMMVCAGTRTRLEQEVKRIWSLGSIIQVKKFRLNGNKGVLELSHGIASYLQKGFDIDKDGNILALVKAIHNVKLQGSTGCMRAFLKEARLYREEKSQAREIPAPPRDPEIRDLAPGTYDKGKLLVMIGKESVTALWMLKTLEYRVRFGRQFEERLELGSLQQE